MRLLKDWRKLFVILIKKMLVAVLILASMLTLVSCSEEYTSTDAGMYQKYISEVIAAADHMPKLTEIGKYESILKRIKVF